MDEHRLREFLHRMRVALAILVGFASGKWLALWMGHHDSEFFVLGFAVGMLLTQWLCSAALRPGRHD